MMTPRLEMMTAFAAAALQGLLASAASADRRNLYTQAWADARAMMAAMPSQADAELTISIRASGMHGLSDQG